MLSSNAFGWSADALAYAAVSRERVTRVWEALDPALLVHGHMHLKDEVGLPGGRRVYSMGMDNEDGNLALLGLDDLQWAWIS